MRKETIKASLGKMKAPASGCHIPNVRLVLAYLLAPLAGPLAFSLLFLGDGVGKILGILTIASSVSYVVSWTGGTIVFLVLKKCGREGVSDYLLSGFGLGFLLPIVMGIYTWDFHVDFLIVALIYGVIGSIVAITFILIRGTRATK